MSVLTGMLIGVEKITDLNSKIWVDSYTNDVVTFNIKTEKLSNIKMGDHLVVYKEDMSNEFNVKLLNDLI